MSYSYRDAWLATPSSDLVSSPVAALSLLSQNVLFDEFEADKLHSDSRWDELLKQVEAMNVDIIGFQEVKATFLEKLLACAWVRESYYISCVDGIHITPYGQIVIAKFPFKVSYYEYSSHKRVVVGTFRLNDRLVHVPCVHLVSDHGKGNLGAKRLAQMTTIYTRTVPEFSDAMEKDNGSDTMIIGDFNMGDGGEGEALSIRSDFVDCWKFLNGNDPGYTFDPELNALAAITTKTGVRRRYDRLLVRSSQYHWQVLSCSLVNTESLHITTLADGTSVRLPVSDHFGLLTTLQFVCDESERSRLVSSRVKTLAKDKEAANSIGAFLVAERMIETREELMRRQNALQLLHAFIARACPSQEGFHLVPVGSFGLGVQTPTSDIDVLCVSSWNTGDFFASLIRFFHSEARKGRDSSSSSSSSSSSASSSSHSNALPVVATPRLVLDALVPVISVTILNVPIDIQYAQVRNVSNFTRSGFDLNKLLIEAETRPEVRNQFDQASLLAAQSARAVSVLLSLIPDLPTFQKAYLCIKRWAEAKGLTSNRLGFLGGHAWTIMLVRVAQTSPRNISVFGLVHAFFETYANWDWRNHSVSVLLKGGLPIPYAHVSKKEPVCVVTCTQPYKNITRNATHSSRRVLIAELQKAHSAVVLGGNPLDLLTQQLWKPVDFFNAHSSYLQVNFSAATYREYAQFAGQVESRLVQLLLLLESTPVVLARPWPTRFVYKSSSFLYGGSFFIGLSTIKENLREKDLASNSHLDLAKYADDFIKSIERWAGFSHENMKITIKQRTKESLIRSPPTPETSSTYPAAAIADEDENEGYDESDEDSPSEEEDDANNATAASSSHGNAAFSSASSSASKTNPNSNHNNATAKRGKDAENGNAQGGGKAGKKKGRRGEEDDAAPQVQKRRMKTSEECINWIRHDGRFNTEEFIISYEDRFVGLMEVALAEFATDQQSEVFIPMHRVWLIKQNGRIVWDRKNRMDVVGAEFRGTPH